MIRKKPLALALSAAVGLASVVGSFALADAAKDAKPAAPAAAAAPAGQPEMKLPPGWTMEDMTKVMQAGQPGKMHERLAQGAGTWDCKTTMWMAPGSDPMTSAGTTTAAPFMDGRYLKVEMAGEMPGMGPYRGFGLYGYDNVAGKFTSMWVDNHSTGIMTSTGELSADGKVMTWTYSYHCPLSKKPCAMREVETVTGPTTKTLEMFGTEPKSGKEYKMMSIALTKRS